MKRITKLFEVSQPGSITMNQSRNQLSINNTVKENARQSRRNQMTPSFVYRPLSRLATRRQMMLCCLIVLIGIACNTAQAEHALSEVWSETDGLQMKYSTNHDDLLSTKGSELSLSSVQPSNKQETTAQQASNEGQHEESSPSSGSTSSSDDSGGDSGSSNAESSSSESSNGEQGADASKRADSRVPLMPPAQSIYSTSASKQSRFHEPAARFKSEPTEESSSADGEDGDSSFPAHKKTVNQSKNQDSDDESFSSAADQADREDESAGERTDNVGNRKVHQPGRLFREAVKMGPSSDEVSNADRDKSSASDESDGARAEEQSESVKPETNAANEEPNAVGEPEFGRLFQPAGGRALPKSEALSQRQNMIDFDRIVERQRDSTPDRPSSVRDEVNIEGGSDEDDDEDGKSRVGQADDGFKRTTGGYRQQLVVNRAPRNELAQNNEESNQEEDIQDRPGAYRDHRHMTAGSTAHKERIQPSSQAKGATIAPKTQLAYFRGLPASQANNDPARNRPDSPQSPDSVRDNFISPGHYPGSMPHLTQAASDIRKKELSIQTPENSPIAPVKPSEQLTLDRLTTSSTISTPSSVSQPIGIQDSVLVGGKMAQTGVGSGFAAVASTINQTSDNRVAGGVVFTGQPEHGTSRPELNLQVTPEPESQPESQQIMAPILLSTTTMAPMPSTSPMPATTEAPSLKRFKFRKYR